jgi:anti-anti-sigma factor
VQPLRLIKPAAARRLIHQIEDPVVLVVAGGESPGEMRRTVMDGLAGRARDVILDLGSVDSMSNPGVAVLVGARARQRARLRRLTLVFGRHSATDDALSRSGLRESFATVRTVDAALATVHPVRRR